MTRNSAGKSIASGFELSVSSTATLMFHFPG